MRNRILKILDDYTSIEKLKQKLNINDSDSLKEMIKILNELVDCFLVYEKNNLFVNAEKVKIHVGELRKNKDRLFGFVKVTNFENDFFVMQKI